MCAIRLLTALFFLSILYLCDNIVNGERQNKVAHEKIKYTVSIQGRGNKLINPANYSVHTGDVVRVQHYSSVDARKCLEPGVAGERHKSVCTVDRAWVY